MSDIEQRVKKIVAEQLGVAEDEIKLESSFVDDLGADSLDTVELVMALEDEFEIEIPDEYTGTIIGDISRRRGRIEGQEPLGNTGNVIVRATVPLGNMFGYATDLRSNTQGRGTFSMEFLKYEQVPANVQEEIISKSGARA